jgi:hypothetical protein
MLVSVSLAVILLCSMYPLSQAQAATAFTAQDQFLIPQQNSTIRFAVNGSYTAASLQKDTWIFRNLTVNTPQTAFLGLTTLQSSRTLTFSAENSNVTILAFQTFNYSSPVSILSYTVDGAGSQTVNLGLEASQPMDSSEWSVIVPDDVFLAEGEGWQLLPDNSLFITAQASNITIIHFDFASFDMGNVGFLLQHYVLLLSGVVLAVTLAVAVVIKVKRDRHTLGIRNSNKPTPPR